MSRTQCGPIDVWRWGLESTPGDHVAFAVSRVVRDTHGAVSQARVAESMRTDPKALTRLLPPFGAAAGDETGAWMVADSMGFQQLFHTDAGSNSAGVMSSSALAAAWTVQADLDRERVGIQSLLGWQLGQGTLFAGIRKLSPGAVARIDERGVQITDADIPQLPRLELAEAVTAAAELLRTSLNALLDDHPDAVLQLTGGMDSRLLLSAIPEKRRRGLRAMTLEVPGKGDVAIASAISERYGIRHDVHGLTDVGDIDPAEAWDLCVADAVRLDGMSDPVALAAQRIGERAFDQGVRISGLGGEIARGFYYVGRIQDRPYTRKDAEQLASWRMFVNEAVEPGLLDLEFAAWARKAATDRVYQALRAGGDEWFRAADELYVRHRMQRWAGATDIAVADQRTVVNPMLDPGFLDIASQLTPQDKAGSRFLGALQMALDPELGQRPLDGRPAPSAYATPSRWQPAVDVVTTGRRLSRKAVQRLQRGNRPPAGGTVMAAKVVEHWRRQPDTLRPLGRLDFVRDEWLEDVLSGRVEPRPSSVAFVTNLVVATS
ncbi:hypothetical protein [Microbacterium pumilum]|uniref:hypothetical protein n=1 Tax=Microbacterium pumilum TaxID=344165 RepID=UPI0031CE7F25